jgi:hypothetical protein
VSLENDARECLLGAIGNEFHQQLDAGDLNTVKPSDADFKSDFVRWRHVLERTCECLRSRHYRPGEPTNDAAKDLLDVEMSRSLGYIVKLMPKRASRKARVAFAAVAGTVFAAAVSTMFLRSRRRRGRGAK